jgi:hypothetical protein
VDARRRFPASQVVGIKDGSHLDRSEIEAIGQGDQFAKEEAYDRSKRMNDQATILIALNEAAFIIADHFEPGTPRDPVETIKRLIDVLDSQELAAAISGSERGRGLRVVN